MRWKAAGAKDCDLQFRREHSYWSFSHCYLLPVFPGQNLATIYCLLLLLHWWVGGQLLFARANYPNVAASALMLDAVILTYMLFAPNPWTELEWPTATIYKFSGWRYLFVFLAAATIGHSWRIVLLFWCVDGICLANHRRRGLAVWEGNAGNHGPTESRAGK